MKWIVLFVAAVALFLTYSCTQRPETAVLLVYQNGNRYEILDKGDLLDGGKPVRFIRYYSEAPFNDAVREREHRDLLTLMARHSDTNMNQQVFITSVERDERLFGLIKPREHIAVYSAEEVMKYAPQTK